MKKAKIILSLIAVLAVLGGAYAFKAARFSGINHYTLTRTYVNTLGISYTSGAASFCAPISTLFRTTTTTEGVLSTIYSTNGTTSPVSITLHQVGGTGSVLLPAWTCTTTRTLVTTANF